MAGRNGRLYGLRHLTGFSSRVQMSDWSVCVVGNKRPVKSVVVVFRVYIFIYLKKEEGRIVLQFVPNMSNRHPRT